MHAIEHDPGLFPRLEKLHVLREDDSYKRANKKRQRPVWFGTIRGMTPPFCF